MATPLSSDHSGAWGDKGVPNDIGSILSKLEQNIEVLNLSEVDLCQIFTQLKSFIVQSCDSSLLFTQRTLHLLCGYGFHKAPKTASHIALRCVCNLLLLSEPTRQIFVDQNRAAQAVDKMRSDHLEDQLVTSRLLLLCTYGTDLDLDHLVESSDICSIIHLNLTRYKSYIQPCGSFLSGLDQAACEETLKLLCNLMAFLPHKTSLFDDCLAPLFDLLRSIAIPSPPLQPPISSLINCLVFFKFERATQNPCYGAVFPVHKSNANVDCLVKILTLAAQSYSSEDLDKYGSPLMQVLLRVAEISPPGPKARLKSLILPSADDRKTVLGEGRSLSAILLRAATSVVSSRLRHLIPSLFFELSDKDPQRLVHNVGYGYASGFLLSLGTQLPPNSLNDIATEVTTKQGLETNPVSGQIREREPKIDIPEMTEEEKGREAERLFVLFERLRATGVINVENPVSIAAQNGRLEEIE